MADETGGADTGATGGTQGGGTSAPDWAATLDGDAKAVVTAKGWKSPVDVIKGYANLEKLVGMEKIPVPGKDAAPEAWDAVFARLGRPESPDKYDLGDFKPPEGLPWNEDGQKVMLGAMHKAGLSSRQARAVLDAYAAYSGKTVQAMNATIEGARQSAADQLRKEWGGAYDAKIDLANRAFKMAFGDKVDAARQIKLADGSYLGDNPALVRAFAKFGESLGEESLKGQGGGRMSQTPDEAKAELARFHGDKDIMAKLTDKTHPEYAALQAKRTALFQAAYPA